MSNLLIIIITILIYSLLLTINILIKDWKGYDISIGDIILSGIFTWIIMLVNLTIRKIPKIRKGMKYKSLIEDENGNIFYCNSNKVDDILENTNMKFTNKDFDEYFKYWNKKFCSFRKPNVRYAPKIIWKQFKKYKGEK